MPNIFSRFGHSSCDWHQSSITLVIGEQKRHLCSDWLPPKHLIVSYHKVNPDSTSCLVMLWKRSWRELKFWSLRSPGFHWKWNCFCRFWSFGRFRCERAVRSWSCVEPRHSHACLSKQPRPPLCKTSSLNKMLTCFWSQTELIFSAGFSFTAPGVSASLKTLAVCEMISYSLYIRCTKFTLCKPVNVYSAAI